ncbi:MAG: VCBS repeat-containing protein [Planctomycetes bacterium]|nr:VCBS repeat-containing protein [Planctomycetota bacterium]
MNHGGRRYLPRGRQTVNDNSFQLSSVDLDGDGKPDLLVQLTGLSTFVLLARNLGGGDFAEVQPFLPPGVGGTPVVGDFDKDGNLDGCGAGR